MKISYNSYRARNSLPNQNHKVNTGAAQTTTRLPSAYDVMRSTASSSRAGRGSTPTNGASSTPTAAVPEIATAKFMAQLESKLSESGDDPGSYLRSQSMLSALKAGTLHVTDAIQGKEVTAWDADNTKATSNKVKNVAKTDWSHFLGDHLKRDDNGVFQKTAEGHYVDKMPGENAYFGRVAGKYYYVTWPQTTNSS